MKTTKLILLYMVILFIGANLSLSWQPEAKGNEPVVIPDEAIRLRILANSNSDEDQALKRKIRDAVNAEITIWVEELTSIDAARTLIQSRLDEIEAIVKKVLEEENSNQTFSVEYGKQVNFPTKLYGSYIYPAGEYEAILISLGKAEGNNWWCVLFPPLCFLDFGNGDAVSQTYEAEADKIVSKEEKVEVKFLLVEKLKQKF